MKKLPVLISEKQIQQRVAELGTLITESYSPEESVVCVGVLKGSILFFSDLIRHIQLPIEIDFLGASSYGKNTISSGVVQITLDLSTPITNRHVLVIEDIVDTGATLHYLLHNLRIRKPASLKLCALLHKPQRMIREIQIDFLGFSIEDHFVVGYGLDFAEKYRNIPYLAALPPSKAPKTR